MAAYCRHVKPVVLTVVTVITNWDVVLACCRVTTTVGVFRNGTANVTVPLVAPLKLVLPCWTVVMFSFLSHQFK